MALKKQIKETKAAAETKEEVKTAVKAAEDKVSEKVEEVKEILTDKMKHAADLRVSLEVDAKTGDSWFDAK